MASYVAGSAFDVDVVVNLVRAPYQAPDVGHSKLYELLQRDRFLRCGLASADAFLLPRCASS